jgi:ubiquitin fusion degradation protein 1
MMQNLLLSEGSFVRFSNVSLPKGTYVKLQPTTSDFLDISNPKAVLERTLRAYSCLTKGDSFVVHYNDREYELEVRESRPGDAVSIIETDCQVDFEAPKDYVEPQRVVAPKAAAAGAAGGSAAGAGGSGAGGAAGPSGFSMGAAGGSAGGGAGGGGAEAAAEDAGPAFVPFVGSGNRLDGKPAAPAPPPPPPIVPAAGAGGAGRKAGTFVSTGNRLLDKLERDRLAAAAARGGGGGEAAGAGAAAPAAAAGGAAAGAGAAAGGSNGAAAAAAKPADGDKTDEGPKFEAFKGKAFTLK